MSRFDGGSLLALGGRPGGKAPSRAGPLVRVLSAVPPPGLVLLAVLSVQVGAAVAIQLFPTLGPSGTVVLRVALSALLLWLAWRPRIDAAARRHAGLLLLYGLSIAGMNLSFYEAIARIPLGIAVTIEFLGPLAIAVAGSRRPRDLLWVLLAAAGLALLTPAVGFGGAGGTGLDPLGVAFAGLGAVGWAGFVLISVRVGRLFERGSGLALGMAAAALLLLPFGVAAAGPAMLDPMILLGVLAVALLSTTIPWSLEFEALKRMPPRAYGILVTLEPAVAVLVGIVLLGEALTWRIGLAVACVSLAAIGVTLFDRRPPGA